MSFFFFLVNPPPAVLLSAHNARMHNDMEAFLGVSFMTIFPFFFLPRLSLLEVVAFFFFSLSPKLLSLLYSF